jgi:hypothetical protein
MFSKFKKFNFKNLKKPAFVQSGKNLFWVWVAYQSVKGILTLSFIWIPLFLLWLHKGS